MSPLRDHDDLGTTPHGGRPHLRPVGGPAPLALVRLAGLGSPRRRGPAIA